jgi:hypothetical protein
MDRSKETFIKHHRDTLKMPWPPAWVIVEVASFGAVSNSLVLLIHLMEIIEPGSRWPATLAKHIETLAPALIPNMGFPADWKQRPLWKKHLATP